MYMQNPNIDILLKTFDQVKIEKNEYLLILIGEDVKFEIKILVDSLIDKGLNFFGGVFPGIISNQNYSSNAIYYTTIPVLQKPLVVEEISNGDFVIPDFRDLISRNQDIHPTIFILVDGLSSNNELFLRNLFDIHGKSVNYIGGGAGSLSFKQKPCIFDSQGFYSDAVLIIPINIETKLRVTHGWDNLHGPLVATKTEKNIIKELNWEIAFNVYQTIINADLKNGEKITKENFFDYSKAYPFGIHKEGYEKIVRDPIAIDEEGGLICVGEVPENAVLYILKGHNKRLIKAVEMATIESLQGTSPGGKKVLMIDCISRSIFLEDQFSHELGVVNQILKENNADNEVYGFLSLGEISSYGDGYLEFFNKTCVIGVFDGVE